MILKLNNRSKNFYTHLGKIFGSRDIERITSDRIYDDDNKEWYIYFSNYNPQAFVSVANNIIKNVWGEKDTHIVKILLKIKDDINVKESIVTKHFKNLYLNAGFKIIGEKGKNFVIIRSENIEEN